MAASNEARIWGVMAASGTGKGLWINEFLSREKPARLVIWDYKKEYQEHAPRLVENTDQLRAAMIKANAGPLRIRFKCKAGTPQKTVMLEFEVVCRLVQTWGNCCFIAEELSNVTTPGWAPPAWREMTTGGRHERVHIIGVAQNPALIDKTFLSNCTMIHVGPLREFRHRQTVARSMDVDVQKLTDLEKFFYIEREHNTRELREGRVSLPPGTKSNTQTPTANTATATAVSPTGSGTAPTVQAPAAPVLIEPVHTPHIFNI